MSWLYENAETLALIGNSIWLLILQIAKKGK